MVNFIKFMAEKIVIVEVMLLILSFCQNFFKVDIPYLSSFISSAITFLLPISLVALIVFIIFNILERKFVKLLICIILIILIYLHYIKGV